MSFYAFPLLLAIPLTLDGSAGSAASASDAETILATMRQRVGVADPTEALSSVRIRGECWWDSGPDKGTITEVLAGLGRAHSVMSFKGFGDFQVGTADSYVWEKHPMQIIIRDGWDGAEYLRRFARTQHVAWQELYEKATLRGEEDLDGVRCHVLEMISKALLPLPEDSPRARAPDPDVWYVDAETYLLRRVVSRSTGDDGGSVAVQIDLKQWRAVDGILYAHRREILMSGFALQLQFHSFEHDVKLVPTFFDPDPEVQDRAAQKAEGGGLKTDPGIHVEELALCHIAGIRREFAKEDMQKVLGVMLPEVMNHVLSVGAQMAGPPLVRIFGRKDGKIDLEAAMRVAQAISPGGRVKSGTLQAGKAVVAGHVGPFDQLEETHQKIQEWVKTQGLTKNGAPWEEYWTDPGMEPDPAKWRTKVVWPVKEP